MRDILFRLCLALCPMLAHAATSLPEQPLFRQVGVADGLPSNGGTALALDRDGFLWIGTRDGLARYDGVGYRIYRYAPGDDNGLPGNYISALWVGSDNRVWVGIEGGGLSVLDAGRERFRHYRPETQPLMRSADVMAIVGDAAGNVWFGTFGGGLYRLDRQNRLHRFLPVAGNPRSLPSENILALAMDGGGQLWVGTTDGLAPTDGRAHRARRRTSGSAGASGWHDGLPAQARAWADAAGNHRQRCRLESRDRIRARHGIRFARRGLKR